MRHLRPQPKEKRRVHIPDELRDSMREVSELIEQSQYDEDLNLDFDDAIQVGRVCGGRVNKKLSAYDFTYFPTDDRRRGRWYLVLHEADIDDIGDGRMASITMYCCMSPDCRTKFSKKDETCFFCDYFEDDPGVLDFAQKLVELAAIAKSKKEFVEGYVRLKPDASSASLIGDYNPIDDLGERLGWFSFPEADEMIRSAKENG